MTLRVATVLSAREWESRLVATARASATVRLVLRAFLPTEVSEQAHELDVVVVGSETPWATTARLASWKRDGLRVVGIHPVGDRPAADRLRAADVDLVLPDDLGPDAMLREIRLIEPAATREDGDHPLVVVTGSRGAPGKTEVSVALAWNLSGGGETILVDGDLDAPSVAIRLGISPRPDLADAVDGVHAAGGLSENSLHRIGRLRVLPGSHRPGDPPLRPEPVFDVVDAARVRCPVIVDAGPWPANQEIVKAATTAVLVVEASPVGVVRAAGIAAAWTGPPPVLVVNRVHRSQETEIVTSVRRWTGIDPIAVIPEHHSVTSASRAATEPARRLRSRLVEIGAGV